jgi:hypothetical protein
MIAQRIRSVVNNPRRSLRGIMPQLLELKEELKRVQANAEINSLVALIELFQVVSPWHDRGLRNIITSFEEVNYGQFNEVLRALKALNKHFENAGRNLSGMNRTKPGQEVTSENVFLGDKFGLWTFSVRSWMEPDTREIEVNMCSTKISAYDAISRSARGFIESHRPMIEIIDQLELIAR